ncbi:MAG: sulfotransferase [bacterium]
MDKKVNLFIVGVNKAGTTWLYHLLKNHPDVQFSSQKELNYFDTQYPAGLKDYHSCFDFSLEKKYFAEGTPSYVRSDKTAVKIKEYNPEAKIIIMLRDPIKRLLSQFYFRKQIGKIPEKLTLEQAITGKDDIIVSDSHYENFVPLWIKNYRKDTIKIISMEEALDNKKKFWHEIQKFLGIQEVPMPEIINTAKNVTGSKSFRLLYRITVLPIKKHLPVLYQKLLQSNLMKKSKRYFLKKFGTQKKKLNISILKQLKEEFSETYSYLFSIGFEDVYKRTRDNLGL